MTEWLLSAAGIAVLLVLVSYLSSGTKMHNTIKTASAYIFILVMIYPLPSLISGSFNFTSCSLYDDFVYDEKIENSVNSEYMNLIEQTLDSKLTEDGYNTVSNVSGSYVSGELVIEKVIITVYGEYADSTSVMLIVKRKTAEYLNVGESIVSVNVKKS